MASQASCYRFTVVCASAMSLPYIMTKMRCGSLDVWVWILWEFHAGGLQGYLNV